MLKSRIVKWAASGILALGAIPAIGMGRSHVSLPTSAVTITPTGMESGAPVTTSHVTRRVTVFKASSRKHASVRTHAKHRKLQSHRKAKVSHRKAQAGRTKSVSHRTHRVASHKSVKHS